MTFKGAPSRVSMLALCAAKQSGKRSCDVGTPSRSATTMTTGSREATAPLTLTVAVASAASRQTKMNARVRLAPDFSTSNWPAQVVTPAASRPVLTTNSPATRTTVGSPKPASASFALRIPVKNSASDTPIPTITAGILFHMNNASAMAISVNTTAMSLMAVSPCTLFAFTLRLVRRPVRRCGDQRVVTSSLYG